MIPNTRQLLDSPFAQRKLQCEMEICDIARRMLSFCLYRRAKEHYCYVNPASHHAIWGARRRTTSFIVLSLASPIGWRQTVYDKGIAVISGCFIFEVMEELAGGALVVRAGSQGRGCSLTLNYAIAHAKRGTWQLSWNGLPGKFRSVQQSTPMTAANDYYRLALLRKMERSLVL